MRARSMACSALLCCVAFVAAQAQERTETQERSGAREARIALNALVQQHCAECHSGDDADAGLDLSAAVSKPLNDALTGRMWRAVQDGRMPPPEVSPANSVPTAAFDAATRAALLRNLSTLLEGAELRQPIAARRLSREELRRSVRDVLHVDAVAEWLPEDELAYSFDNVANVRSAGGAVSEQLLRAAEQIALLVLPEGLGCAPAERRVEAEEFRCSTDSGADSGFVVLYMNATLTTTVTIRRPGHYEIVVRAAERHAGNEATAMPVRIDGRELAVHEVSAPLRAAQDYVVGVDLATGDHQLQVAFTNDYYKAALGDRPAEDRNLHVDFVALRGPISTAPHAPAVALLVADQGGATLARAEAVLRPLLRALWRTTPDATVLRELADIVKAECVSGRSFEEALRPALVAALASPRFWMRRAMTKQDGAARATTARAADRARRAANDAIATRLSFFLWSSVPDATLLNAAESGALLSPAGISAESKRMLADPRASAFSEYFAPQWLELRNLSACAPDAVNFPRFNADLRRSMTTEVVRFVEEVRMKGLPARELIGATWSCIDAPLAAHYGVPAPEQPFARTELPGRGGLLGMGAMLTVTSNPGRTSPVKRGRWILDHLLDAPPAPPPPNAGSLDERPEIAASLPLKARLEAHRRDPSCSSCHKRMDVLGFALEHFDGIGAWRTADGPHAIDTHGALPDGRKVDGLESLQRLLASDRAFLRGLLRAMFTTAIGRHFGAADEAFLDRTLNALPPDATLHDLVLAVVTSAPFMGLP